MERIFPKILDITGADTLQVEVVIRNDRKVIWINVDGICRVRICRIGNLVIEKGGVRIGEGE